MKGSSLLFEGLMFVVIGAVVSHVDCQRDTAQNLLLTTTPTHGGVFCPNIRQIGDHMLPFIGNLPWRELRNDAKASYVHIGFHRSCCDDNNTTNKEPPPSYEQATYDTHDNVRASHQILTDQQTSEGLPRLGVSNQQVTFQPEVSAKQRSECFIDMLECCDQNEAFVIGKIIRNCDELGLCLQNYISPYAGSVFCVASLTLRTDTFIQLYNNQTTVDNINTSQISGMALSSSRLAATIVYKNCTKHQTSSYVPRNPMLTIVIGASISFSTYVFCKGGCTWPSPWLNTVWGDNTYDNITFGTGTLTGWTMTSQGSTIRNWEFLDNSYFSSKGILLLTATDIFRIGELTYIPYLCLATTKIKDYTYYCYQQHGFECSDETHRATLNIEEVCASEAASCQSCPVITLPAKGGCTNKATRCQSCPEMVSPIEDCYEDYICLRSKTCWIRALSFRKMLPGAIITILTMLFIACETHGVYVLFTVRSTNMKTDDQVTLSHNITKEEHVNGRCNLSFGRKSHEKRMINCMNSCSKNQTNGVKRNPDNVPYKVNRSKQRVIESEAIRAKKQSILERDEARLMHLVMCKICLDADACVVFLPCSHMVACGVCSDYLERCPVCRAMIDEFLQVEN